MPAAPGDRGEPGPAETVGRPPGSTPPGVRVPVRSALGAEADCARFLDARTPKQLLEAFAQADPLGLFERCSRYSWDEALFLEPERLHHHAAARVAAMAPVRPPTLPLAEWLDGCIAFAARALVTQDQEDERAGNPLADPWGARHSFICEALGRPAEDGRRACTAFNGLPSRVRRAFFALVMERKSVQECVDAGFGPREWLRSSCLRALAALHDLGEDFDPKSNDGGRKGEAR